MTTKDTPEDKSIRIENMQSRCIVLKGKQVLLMFRKNEGLEYNVFPGGHMEIGENPVETAIREVFEETTIKVKNIKPAYEIFSDTAKGISKEYYFIADWESGEPILSGEESRRISVENFYEPRWVNLKEISKLTIFPVHSKEWLLDNLK